MRKPDPDKLGPRVRRREISGLCWVSLTPIALLRLTTQIMEQTPYNATFIQAALARFISGRFKRIIASIGLRTGPSRYVAMYHSHFANLSEVH